MVEYQFESSPHNGVVPEPNARLLGMFEIRTPAGSLRSFGSRKAAMLVAYLARQHESVARGQLAFLLWGDRSEQIGRRNLSREVSIVSAVLPGAFVSDRDTLMLAPDLLQLTDTTLFETLTARSFLTPSMREPSPHFDPVALDMAVSLYRGDFMSGLSAHGCPEYETWLFRERERWQRRTGDLLEWLIKYRVEQHDDARAEPHIRRWLDIEAWQEEAHRMLMGVLARTGRRSEALAQYEQCRRMLAQELDVEPDDDTQALFEQIRTGTFGMSRPRRQGAVAHGTATAAPAIHGAPPRPVHLVGRAGELAMLAGWLSERDCRLIALTGLGGIGKSTLAAQAAEQAASRFQHIIWTSLLHAPHLEELIPTWLAALGPAEQAVAATHLDTPRDRLFARLGETRCLIVLDNAESVMQSGQRAGCYRAGYEDYGAFLADWTRQRHASCILLTSRELPLEMDNLASESPMRYLKLDGLDHQAGAALMAHYGLGATREPGRVVARYSGNPLALKLVATTIRDLFAGNAQAFLGDKTLIFDDIRHVLDEQFARLSPRELELAFWLAIEREPVSVEALRDNLASSDAQHDVVDTIRSLYHRQLLESRREGVTLQNVVLEYVTDRIVATATRELESCAPDLLTRHALIKPRASEYVRQSQERQLLKPIAQSLVATYGTAGAAARLGSVLASLHTMSPAAQGYTASTILSLLLYLNQDVRAYDFSGLRVWWADLRGATLRGVDFSQADLTGSAFTEAFQVATSLAFSPDGSALVGGTNDGALTIWNATDGQPAFRVEAHSQCIWSVAFSPDGRLLASAGEDRVVHIRPVGDGPPIAVLAGHQGWIRSSAFSPDGKSLASASDDGTVRLWDLASGVCLRVFAGHASRVRAVAFSPDGRLLASAGADGTVRLWDRASGACLHVFAGHASRVRAVAFSPDGRLLASASFDQRVILWNVASRSIERMLEGHTNWVQALAFHPLKPLLASAGADRSIYLWSTDDGAPQQILQGHQHAIEGLAFHSSGHMLASSSRDQTVRLWDVDTGRAIWRVDGHTHRVRTMAISPDGLTLASTSADSMIWLWNLEQRQALQRVRGDVGLIEALCYTPDGRLLACAGEHGVQISEARSSAASVRLRGGQHGVYAIAFDDTGTLLAGGGRSHLVELWDVQTGKRLRTLHGHDDWVKTVAFQPGGRLLASAGDDTTIRLWDLHGDEPCTILQGHGNSVSRLAFSPDGRLLASGSNDQSVRVWDVRSRQQVALLAGHDNGVTSVAFSPDGSLLASAGFDRTIRLIAVPGERLAHVLQGHTGAIRTVLFSPNGRMLISCSDDETVRLWDVRGGRNIAALRAPGPYEGMNIHGVTGLTLAQRQTLLTLGAVEI
jgi:WD40 repeat protein/DNA-binding SARP family transcriptional activator